MKKILEMREPLISSLPIYGDLFSIVKPSEHFDNWICNNFIQLRDVSPVVFFDSYRSIIFNCPYVATTKITRKMLLREWPKPFVDMIKEMIDIRNYIFLYVDRAYISEYCQAESVVHEFFIYGYDDEEEIFYCADNSGTGTYNKFECTFKEVEEAYWKIEECSYFTDVHCINPKEAAENVWYDSIKIHQIYGLLSDYIDSRVTLNFAERFNVTKAGFVLQEDEFKKIAEDKESGTEDVFFDWRRLCVFQEHKKLMVFRLKKLNELYETNVFDEYINVYEMLEEGYKKVINLVLKYNIVPNKKIIDRILERGEMLLGAEKKILPGLKKCIEQFL